MAAVRGFASVLALTSYANGPTKTEACRPETRPAVPASSTLESRPACPSTAETAAPESTTGETVEARPSAAYAGGAAIRPAAPAARSGFSSEPRPETKETSRKRDEARCSAATQGP